MQKKILRSCPVLFLGIFWFVAKLPIIQRKMQKKWWSSLGRFSQIWWFLVFPPPPFSLLTIIKTSQNQFSFQVLIFYFTFWRIFTQCKKYTGTPVWPLAKLDSFLFGMIATWQSWKNKNLILSSWNVWGILWSFFANCLYTIHYHYRMSM